MLERFRGQSIDEIERGFRWELPAGYNLGLDCADRQPAARTALIHEWRNGKIELYTFGALRQLSNRFAHAVAALGVGRGDRVAIVLPQEPTTLIAHLALYKLGAIAVPMSTLFGPDALEVRLRDSGTRLVVTNAETAGKIEALRDRLPALAQFILTERVPTRRPAITAQQALAQGASDFRPAATAPDDPALLIYTSGTTGGPKGALHGHRLLFGHLPGFELSHDFFPQPGDCFWTPADWAWIGGLMDALFPALHHGHPTVSFETAGPFDPERALAFMARHGVRNTFLPPTALKMMRQVDARPPEGLRLRSIMSGGEVLGEEMLAWAQERLGVTINEIFGQTECNYVVGNCSALYPVRPGKMGRPYPGHTVAVLDDAGAPVPPGTRGEVAVRRPDPVMFLEYWQNPAGTQAKYLDDWLLTGDLAIADADGYLQYAGRKDDIINSAGYRIGPAEIEECLMRHPAVAMAAVIGVPDRIRGEIVKAYLTLKVGVAASAELTQEIQGFVKRRLAAYEYPREVEFIADMPLTTTGKIRRTALREMHRQVKPG